jgi:NADPH2:quinone reductase
MPTLPTSMTAIAIREAGGPEMLEPQSRPLPALAEGQILVKVAAAGVNRPDVMQRLGGYPPPPGAPDIPGLEIAGTVVALGPGADRYAEGDAVTALVPGGGYGEYCAVHASNALPVPRGLSMVEASSLPETYFTVWHNVFERGRLQAGETLLVHGGSSGIGTTAIQLGRAFGARVFVTAGTDAKCAACRDLGAEAAINYRTEDFVAEAKRLTDGVGVDVILDMVAGSYVPRNWDAAAPEGRILQIALLGGATEKLSFRPLIFKRLTHTGSTMRTREIGFKAGLAAALEKQVWPLLEAGTVRPVIDSTFPLAEAHAAHRRMESSEHIGKIVLTVAD